MVLGITGFDRKPSFEKDVRKLSHTDKIRLRSAVEDLASPKCPPSRNLEKLTNYKDIYSIRVSRRVRLTFSVVDGVAILRRVGSHDEVYSNP